MWQRENRARRRRGHSTGAAVALAFFGFATAATAVARPPLVASHDALIASNASAMLEQGRAIFRYDTFGDEAFWTGVLHLEQAIATVDPQTALAVGLKVDVDAAADIFEVAGNATKPGVPSPQGSVPLGSLVAAHAPLHVAAAAAGPSLTLELLKRDAIVGVKGTFDAQGKLTAIGIRCALCHSTVDDSFAPGVGRRLDGWANRDLDVGAIVSLAPDLQPVADLLGVDQATVRKVLASWGPGRFDAELFMDGKAFRPDGGTGAVLIPPAYGLAGVNMHTYTGWGSVTYWNAFVANLEMHGRGTFFDPRLNDPAKFPVASRAGFADVRSEPDLVTPKLAALHFYQLAIPAPAPPPGNFDGAAAERGRLVFDGKGRCSTCHVPPLFTEPGWNMHRPDEIGIDDFQASRSPDERYRTTPLKGLWSHTRGGFYHDGRFPTLRAVIDHYDGFLGLGLSDQEKGDLAEYLKSL